MSQLIGVNDTGLNRKQWIAVPLLALLAIFFGLVAVTAEPILIALVVAGFVGVLLLLKPTWIISLVLALGLLVSGLVTLWVEGIATKSVWGISILGFVLMFLAFFRVLTTHGVARGTPGFVWMALAFVVYAVINSLGQWSSPGEFIGGFKHYFQAFGLMFALCWLPISEQDVSRWRKLFVVAAVVQSPFAIYQLIRLVPLREAVRYAYGLVPIDVVAGTFGGGLYTGGANGEMVAFLIIVLVFLVARFMEGILPLLRFVLLGIVALTPLYLGETKIVIFMLPLAFVVLFRREVFRRPHYALLGLVAIGLLTVAAGIAYIGLMKAKSPEKYIVDTVSYNFENVGYGGRSNLNRKGVITFWAHEQGLHDPVSAIFGNGVGSSHGVAGGHLVRRYGGLNIGLTGASTLLWDQGVLGTLLFLSILALAWRTAGQLQRQARESWVRADTAAMQAALSVFALFLPYGIGILENMGLQIVFASLLGYLAWLHRRQPSIEASSAS